jgi:hypothetical protein
MVWPISDIFLKTVRFPAAADRVICWCSDEFLGWQVDARWTWTSGWFNGDFMGCGDIFWGIPGVTKHGQGNLL